MKETYTLNAGRCIVQNGKPLFTMNGVDNYSPTELDALAHAVVASLNFMEMAAKVWSGNWSEKTPEQRANSITLAAESEEIVNNFLNPE